MEGRRTLYICYTGYGDEYLCGMGSRNLSVRLNPRIRTVISQAAAAKET
jgi:hypothetical protein